VSVLGSWLGRVITPRSAGFWSAFQGGETTSGESVTPDSALRLSAAWSCVRLISETVGFLPLQLNEGISGGGKVPAPRHPLYELLRWSPNADQGSEEFWEGCAVCLCLWGNFFAEISRNAGRVVALTPMRPDHVTVFRDAQGARRYAYADPMTGARRELGEREVFHVRGFGAGGDVGLSPISYARKSMGAAMAAETAAATTYANGARPTGVLTTPSVLSNEQREQVRKNIVAPMVGAKNSGGVFVLEADFKFQPVTIKPEDAQMLQTRAWSVEDVCRWFRVPPFMVGHTGSASNWGTGLEQQNLGFLTYTLSPYLRRITGAIRTQLIPRAEWGRYVAEHDVTALKETDSAGRAELFTALVNAGIWTRNEARSKDALPPKPGGDDLTIPVNLAPAPMHGRTDKQE